MKWFKKSKVFLMLLPVLLLFGLLIGYGTVAAFLESIQTADGFSFDVYRELLQQDLFIDSFFYSLKIALVSTVLSVVIGFVLIRAAYPKLQKLFPRFVAWLPMLFPHFVWGYMLLLLLGQTGLMSDMLVALGIIDSPETFPILFKDPYGIGIILSYVWKEVPFVMLLLLPVYEQMSHTHKENVYTLGGKQFAAFRYVEWPYVFPVLLEAFVIIFAFIFSAYEVPALLGATYPKMVPVLSYDWFFGSDWSQQSYAFAAMILTTIVICAFVWLMLVMTRKQRLHLHQNAGVRDGSREKPRFSTIAFLIITCMTMIPLLLVVWTSVASFSSDEWRALIGMPGLGAAIWTSILISIIVILLNFLLGVPAAKVMAHHAFPGKTAVSTLLLLPILIPLLLVVMGIHVAFLRLGLANHLLGVVIVHLLPTLPYTIKILQAGFENIGSKQEAVADSLGASRFEIYRSIYLPQLLPSIRSVIFLVSAISLGQYLLTAMIGGGNVTTLAIYYFPFTGSANDGLIASFSLLFALIPVLIWLAFELILWVITPYKGGVK